MQVPEQPEIHDSSDEQPIECEFCGDPATTCEEFDRKVYVCDNCRA
jgi:hypothetical protein